MRSAYYMMEDFIEDNRKNLDRPGLYEPFEDFVKNHIRDRKV